MDNMFRSCSSLISIPELNTSNVNNMNNMFNNCSSLTTIPLINTSNVTSMKSMLEDCKSLTTIPLFDTSNVTNISFMFRGCSNLVKIPLIDTAKVINMSNIFSSCYNIRYMLLKNLGAQEKISSFMEWLYDTKWGVEDESIPESAGARQSMIDSMITYSFDRATAGYSPLTYELSSESKAVLTEEEIAAVTAKGYTIA